MNKIPERSTTLLLLASILLVSCTLSDPVRVEEDFGNSVRNMVEQQKVDPESGTTTAPYKPYGLDGDSAMNSLGQYRSTQKKNVTNQSLDSFVP